MAIHNKGPGYFKVFNDAQVGKNIHALGDENQSFESCIEDDQSGLPEDDLLASEEQAKALRLLERIDAIKAVAMAEWVFNDWEALMLDNETTLRRGGLQCRGVTLYLTS